MRHYSSHVAASRQAADGNTVRFDVQFRCRLTSLLISESADKVLEIVRSASYPLDDLPRIIDGCRKGELRRHTVVDVDDFDVDIVADAATPRRLAFKTS